MSDYANDESYLSPPGSSRTTGSRCKGAGLGYSCTFDDLEAWQKRLNEVMEDLKSTRSAIKKEYEASDPGVFSAEEEHKIKQALGFSQKTLNAFSNSDYVGKPSLEGLKKLSGLSSGAISLFSMHYYAEATEEMADMIHKGALSIDRLNAVADSVNALTPDAYTPHTPREPLSAKPGVRSFLIGAGIIVGGSMVIGGVRGYRSVTRG